MLSACASTNNTEGIRLSLNPKRYKKKEDFERFDRLVQEIVTRNSTVEKSKDWLKEAYGGFLIKRLGDLPPSEYAGYKKFMKYKLVFIVVHPAYYAFFENEARLPSGKDGDNYPEKNLVERFYERPSFFDHRIKIAQEQERLLRDFIEVASTDRSLLLMVLPGKDYIEHLSSGYAPGMDEYARYINEAANESESVLYVQSDSWETGFVPWADMEKVVAFLKAVEAKTIILGGGYVGRCLQTFHAELEKMYPDAKVYLAPEITAVSLKDLDGWDKGLLTSEGRINFKVAARNLETPKAYGIQVITPTVRGIAPFSFYPPKKKN